MLEEENTRKTPKEKHHRTGGNKQMKDLSKGKLSPLQVRLWPRGWVEVKLHSFMTAALEGGEWSAARPGLTLTPGATRYPLYRRLGGPQGRSGLTENLAPPGFFFFFKMNLYCPFRVYKIRR